jgi:hypothetical protein
MMFIVFDKDGNPWGPFKSALEAAAFATKKWPDQKESIGDDYGNPGDGWTVAFLRGPDMRGRG